MYILVFLTVKLDFKHVKVTTGKNMCTLFVNSVIKKKVLYLWSLVVTLTEFNIKL